VKVAAVALGVIAVAGVTLAFAAPWHHGGAAQSGELSVTQSMLRPGTIALVLENGSEEVAQIAQVVLNDAYVDFRAPRVALAPGAAETITVSYPWILGEAYEIELLTSTGRSVDYAIEDAA
jgi:zinc transporter, ZIP family